MATVLDFYSEITGLSPRRTGSKNGGEFRGPCPFCGGDKNSTKFALWPLDPARREKGGSFYCFACGASGDGIEFLRKFKGLSFKEACQTLGIAMEREKTGSKANQKDPFRLFEESSSGESLQFDPPSRGFTEDVIDPATYSRKLELFAHWCHKRLQDDFSSHAAFFEKRGITWEIIKRYRLGVNPGEGGRDIFRERAEWGLRAPEPGKRFVLPAGYTIPWAWDAFGRCGVKRVRVRRFNRKARDGSELPKYHVIKGGGTSTWFSTSPPALDNAFFMVVETELDAMMLEAIASDLVGVIALGSLSGRPDSIVFPALKRASRIILSLDYELREKSKEGATMALKRAVSWWKEQFGDRLFIHFSPFGKDPGEFFEAHGASMVRDWILEALPASYRVVCSRFQGEEKADFLKKETEGEAQPSSREGQDYGDTGPTSSCEGQDYGDTGPTSSRETRESPPADSAIGLLKPESNPLRKSKGASSKGAKAKEGPLHELKALMKRYGLAIKKTGSAITLIEPKIGKAYTQEAARRFSYLAYMEPESADHIFFSHPGGIITWKNLFEGKEAA